MQIYILKGLNQVFSQETSSHQFPYPSGTQYQDVATKPNVLLVQEIYGLLLIPWIPLCL